MTKPLPLILAGSVALGAIALAQDAATPAAKPAATPAVSHELGYTDTPIIPGTKWHVHDSGRPQPEIVTPGTFPTQERPGTAPSDAVVLFDGKDLSKWKAKDGSDAKWTLQDGYMEVNGTGDIFTKDDFGPDMQLHVEWTAPNPPVGTSQGRGNSGVFFFGRYEMQVLDNYQNQTYPDGQATGIYGYMPPLVNSSLPPGTWQTYDFIFEGPRFKDNKLEKPAYVTTFHNGVVTQNHIALIGETPHKQVGTYHLHPEKGPIKLQDHHNPDRYRMIWIRELHLPGPEDLGDGPKIGEEVK